MKSEGLIIEIDKNIEKTDLGIFFKTIIKNKDEGKDDKINIENLTDLEKNIRIRERKFKKFTLFL